MFKIFESDVKLDSVTVRAQAPDGPLSVEIKIESDCYLESGTFLHQMAARRQIQDLMESSIGKKHALKIYDQFSPNTSCFWGKYRNDQMLPQLCNFTKFMLQK